MHDAKLSDCDEQRYWGGALACALGAGGHVPMVLRGQWCELTGEREGLEERRMASGLGLGLGQWCELTGEREGLEERRMAAAPATWGAAWLVPVYPLYPLSSL